MIKVKNKVPVREVAGEDCDIAKGGPELRVASHWLVGSFVVLEWKGANITVCADDLRSAINNSTNTGPR